MDYYEKEFRSYFSRTADIDTSEILIPFISMLNPGATIWDIGCGSGRDLKWLRNKGFNPIGIERSAGLALMAERHSGCRIIKADFETFDFKDINADGMLLISALVHIHKERLHSILRYIIKGVKPDGLIYISMKKEPDGNPAEEERLPLIEKEPSDFHESLEVNTLIGTGFRQKSAGEEDRIFYRWHPSELEHIFEKLTLEIIDLSEKSSFIGNDDIWLGYTLRKKQHCVSFKIKNNVQM